MHLSSYHAAPVDPLREALAGKRAAECALRRVEQERDEMKDAYRQAGDREHVLETRIRTLEIASQAAASEVALRGRALDESVGGWERYVAIKRTLLDG